MRGPAVVVTRRAGRIWVGWSGCRRAPGLAGLLERVDPAAVSDADDLVELVAACRRIKAWADGIEVETAAALASHPVCDDMRRPGTGSRRSGPPAS